MRILEKIFLGLLLSTAAVVLIAAFQGKTECTKTGGTYVRSIFWFECIEGR